MPGKRKTPRADPDRERKLRRAFLLPKHPAPGGVSIRPFTLWTLDFCDELGLSFFVSADQADDKPAVTLNRLEQLSALVWGHSTAKDPGEIDAHLFAGTWLAEVKAFHRSSGIGSSAKDLSQYIGYIAELINAATVKIRPRKRKKGEKVERDPADLLNPAGRTALMWSVSGGQLKDEAQFRYLYREMPLPVLLQFYHAACREAQLLTVAPGKAKTAERAAARQKTLSAVEKTPQAGESIDFL